MQFKCHKNKAKTNNKKDGDIRRSVRCMLMYRRGTLIDHNVSIIKKRID